MQENYLAKWLNGELSAEELESFKKSGEYDSYARLIEAAGNLEAPIFEVEPALDRLREEGLKAPKVMDLKPFKTFLRLAAAIALLIVGSYFYLDNTGESVVTGIAQRSELRLPDSSEVFLNADSRISYNEKKWDRDREVTLEGEAFFKVAKGRTFTVSTDHGPVSVLGTHFNVEAREDYFEVNCFEGSVRITHGTGETDLTAGTSFLAIDGKRIETEGARGNQPTWIDHESSFESIPLKYVLAELQRQFNIKVSTQNVDTQLLFTGTFDNTDLEMALKSISTPSQISYRIEGDNVLFYAGNSSQ